MKKKFKIFFENFLRLGLSGLLIAFVLIAPFTVFKDLLVLEAEVNRQSNFDFQGVLELWHVETFEGGSVARSAFLEKEAKIFENEHKGTIVLVETMDLEQFSLNISAGKKPDMLSFGVGVGDGFIENLTSLDSQNIRSDLLGYGKFNGKQLAVPYILGGYAIISKAENLANVGVGLKGTTNPLKCLAENGMKIKNLYETSKQIDSYDAYDKFLKGNFDTLIGTQRDVYRCKNRQSKGLLECSFNYLSKYTDLVQYFAIFKNEEAREDMCKKYLAQITSIEAQSKLKNYNLFSTLSDLRLYQNDDYKDFENALSVNLKSENAFVSLQEIENKKQEAFNSVIGG